MWLHPLIPKRDELLSSWLLRLSRIHSLKPHSFCDIVWPKLSVWNRDIDVSAGEKIFNELEDNTLANITTVKSTCLKSYEGIITEYISAKTKNKWLTSIGVLHRTHKKYGQMFCPLCLSEEGYYRKNWRLTISTECTKHSKQLLDRCQICDSPVVPKRTKCSLPLSTCFKCNAPLHDQYQCNSSIEDLKRQRFFELVIDHGWIKNRNRQIHSLSYFQLVDKLLWLVCRRQFRSSLYNADFLDILDNKTWSLPLLNVNERRMILRKVWYFLENYPSEIISFIRSQDIPWSLIQGDIKIWPYFTEIDLHSPLTHALSASCRVKCQAMR